MIYKQPRETRILAGTIAAIFGLGMVFFSALAALESFSEHPIGISFFLILALSLLSTGLYFVTCTPFMELDRAQQQVTIGVTCIFFQKRRGVAFNEVKEVGIKELYQAGAVGEESGTFYYAEISCAQHIEVPGSKNTNLSQTVALAKEVAEIIGAKLNMDRRKVFTGSFKGR